MASWVDITSIIIAVLGLVVAADWFGLIKEGGLIIIHRRRALRFKWANLHVGASRRLHICEVDTSSAGSACCMQTQPKRHLEEKSCWQQDTSFAGVLNIPFRSIMKFPTYAEVPADIPRGTNLMLTDVRTLLAFALMTTQSRPEIHWDSDYSGGLTSKSASTSIQFDTWRRFRFCHVQGTMDPVRRFMEKPDLELILEGYPPWYRSKFKTWRGLELDFPIKKQADVPRGGWIVAVGLMKLEAGQKPLPLYRCTTEPRNPVFRRNGGVFRDAIERCLSHITKNIQTLPAFANNKHVEAAVIMLRHLHTTGTGSGIPRPSDFSETHCGSDDPQGLLTKDSCIFLMDIFKDFGELNDGDIDRLKPILRPAMAAVVQGAYAVVEYLKDEGTFLELPGQWSNLDMEVYLMDCKTRLPST